MATIELAKLDADKRDDLIGSSLEYLTAVTRCLGANAGQQTFESIIEHLGKELSDSLWMKMLTGDYRSTVYVQGNQVMANVYTHTHATWQSHSVPGSINKINFIKMIRLHTSFGLKESKDLVDAICRGHKESFDFDSYETATKFRADCKIFSSYLIVN